MAKNDKKKTRKSGCSSSKKPKRASKIGAGPKSDGIEMSRQLLRSMREPRSRANRSSGKKKAVEPVYGKQHMPPLSELEKMFEESDDELAETTPVDSKAPTLNDAVDVSSSDVIISPTSISPTIVKKYADKILQILNSNEEPPPIIPVKKFKKSGVPYIVNCTERPKVLENKNCNVFKGDDYGITSKTNAFNIEENCTEKSGFNCSVYSLSNSIFNTQANEIASKLLSTDNKLINGGSDSDDTVVYELNSAESRFSPQPSTSKDSKTILKNEKKFNESFVAWNKSFDEVDLSMEQNKVASVQDGLVSIDVEMNEPIDSEKANIDTKLSLKSGVYHGINNIIEQPSETIEIDDDDDDEIYTIDDKNTYNKDVCTGKTFNKILNNNPDIEIQTVNEICEIIDATSFKSNNNVNKKFNESIYINNSPIIVVDDPQVIAEIDLTNINDVISENKSMIDKYSKQNPFNTVSIVEADVPSINTVENTSIHKNVLNKQFRSEGNQKNVIPNTKKDIANELQQIMKKFFDNIENIVIPHNHAINSLSSYERILPQCNLNKSVNSLPSINNLSKNVESPCDPLHCPICLDNLSQETVASTNCGHLFCILCITKALKSKPKRCPTCRKKLTGAGYHHIFM
ncbi:probable E3 ubiquitin-protein ligase bre1 [Pararge aegeria]|uniref:probable E3 ubiquitin-protein ligase bre1 n=1 Tax=Pararge aegeria TaxID=116150 RepID=UPI0019D2F04A|nr:probable E3 ubiquitin-protein ligase bre1 [Pararge aegeria]